MKVLKIEFGFGPRVFTSTRATRSPVIIYLLLLLLILHLLLLLLHLPFNKKKKKKNEKIIRVRLVGFTTHTQTLTNFLISLSPHSLLPLYYSTLAAP